MKPSKTRLKDVLDNKVFNKEKWDMIIGKLKKLGTAIEMSKGPGMSIDDTEYRWVNDRIEYFDNDKRLLTKDEMQTANELWKKYGTKA
tara:strand:- start:115 stop:378 length:264 start_codon:yes stop_codon:yes gene_type:complete